MTRYVVKVEEVWCKGCRICVNFCPHEVMAINKEAEAVVQNAAKCTGCILCEFRCPDLAITVERCA